MPPADVTFSLIQSPLAWGLLVGGLGLWVSLAGPETLGRRVAPLLGAASLILLAIGMRASAPLPIVEQLTFWLLAFVAIVGAAAAVSARDPVHTAIWFACSVLGVAGLMVLRNAQFLGIATIVVYAGAIVVTFLFVLMLAQPEGHTNYDRLSWASLAPLAAVVTSVALVALVFVALAQPIAPRPGPGELNQEQSLARFGAELFSRHLVSVELSGALLLAALVGAISIVLYGRPLKPPAGGSAARAISQAVNHE